MNPQRVRHTTTATPPPPHHHHHTTTTTTVPGTFGQGIKHIVGGLAAGGRATKKITHGVQSLGKTPVWLKHEFHWSFLNVVVGRGGGGRGGGRGGMISFLAVPAVARIGQRLLFLFGVQGKF